MLLGTRLSLTVTLVGLAAAYGCGGQFPGMPVVVKRAPVPGNVAPVAEKEEPAEGCLVNGRVVSADWRDRGGGIERAIVSVWTLPKRERIKEVYGKGEPFEVRLPPGKYRLVCSANGTRGATFEVVTREIEVAEDLDHVDMGKVDLPISKTTRLYGEQAPELAGIIAWQDTPPIKLEALRGHVVVLDFFGYYCSICHEHKPDLVKLREKYQADGLIVLAVHDSSLATLDEMNEKMRPTLRRIFDGDPPTLPMALDGAGERSVFNAYGIYAVPAVILIDQQGRVVRRYHHAGKPELDTDVQSLLSSRSQPLE